MSATHQSRSPRFPRSVQLNIQKLHSGRPLYVLAAIVLSSILITTSWASASSDSVRTTTSDLQVDETSPFDFSPPGGPEAGQRQLQTEPSVFDLIFTLPTDAGGFATVVDGLGDIDGDGNADMVIGNRVADPGGLEDAGSAFVYSGEDGTLLHRFDGTSSKDYFGSAVDGPGDLNGDDIPDIVVGAYGQDAARGAIYVYSGADFSLLTRVDGPEEESTLGLDLESVPDTDGDDVPDFLVLRYSPTASRSYTDVYSGADMSFLQQVAEFGTGGRLTLEGRPVGDFNADSVFDWLIYASFYSFEAGAGSAASYVYSGEDASLIASPEPVPLDYYLSGQSIGAGDLNDDGLDDFWMGSSAFYCGREIAPGGVRAYFGPTAEVGYEVCGEAGGDSFGASVARVPDRDGDGVSELIVGAPYADPEGLDFAGSAYLVRGKTGEIIGSLDGETARSYLGLKVATVGDVDGDRLDDAAIVSVAPDGIAQVNIYSVVDVPPYLGMRVVSPNDWAMVLSVRPTFRWEGLPGAERYVIHIHRVNDDYSPGGELPPSIVGASSSRDPEIPEQHTFKLVDTLTSGSSLDRGAYYWYVEAQDIAGNFLGESTVGSFQIPGLGSWEAVVSEFPTSVTTDDNPYWHQFDDMIYEWGERFDLPPTLLKAVATAESGSFLGPRLIGGQPWSPARAYLYEPGQDYHIHYVWPSPESPQGPEPSILEPFGLPDNPPAVFPYDVVVEGAPTIFEYSTEIAGQFSYLFGVKGKPLTSLPGCATLNPFTCVANRPEVIAQYRISASYGLGQTLYFSHHTHLKDFLGLEEELPPEELYDPEISLSYTAYFLSRIRCSRRPDLHLAYVDFRLWGSVLLGYNGGGNAQYDDGIISRQSVVQPIPLAGENPAILYPDVVDVCGSEPFADNPNEFQVAWTSSAPQQQAGERTVASALVDLWGDGNSVWVRMSVLEDESGYGLDGFLRVYADPTMDTLLWESPRFENVNESGIFRLVELPEERLLLVDWYAGPHAVRTYPIVADDGELDLLTVSDNEAELDGIGSDGGGTFILDDGSIIAYQQRYQAIDERQVNVFARGDSGYEQERSYIVQPEVTDEMPPTTTLNLDPAPNESGWAQSPTWLTLSASDDSAVFLVYVSLSGPDIDLTFTSSLAEVTRLLEEGRWQVAFHSQDIYGNQEAEQQATVLVDGTPPTSLIDLEGTTNADGDFISQVRITLAANDPLLADGTPGSDLATIEYSLDDGASWQIYSDPFVLDQIGEISLLYRAVDQAGNVESSQIKPIKIVPPSLIVQPGEDVDSEEGALLELLDHTSFTHEGGQGDLDRYSATVDWGEGQGSETAGIQSEEDMAYIQLVHTYVEDGDYQVLVQVCSPESQCGEGSFWVHVANLPPSVDAGPDQDALTGEEVQFAGTYQDPGALDTHTILWDFGDGSTAKDTLTPTHVYDVAGDYTVKLMVTDDEGAPSSDNLLVSVTEIPPTAFVLDDFRSDRCMWIDPVSGAYLWHEGTGEEYRHGAIVYERGIVLFFHSVLSDPNALRGLILPNGFGMAFFRTPRGFRGAWMHILDREVTIGGGCL